MIAESLAVFFVKDKIGVSGLYPAIGCGAGFLAFLVCTIMYACGYRPQARWSKHPAYILNASILFVIAVIAVTMIAVDLKVDLKQPAELLKYVLLPVAYLLNLVFFAVFYYLFSLNSKTLPPETNKRFEHYKKPLRLTASGAFLFVCSNFL